MASVPLAAENGDQRGFCFSTAVKLFASLARLVSCVWLRAAGFEGSSTSTTLPSRVMGPRMAVPSSTTCWAEEATCLLWRPCWSQLVSQQPHTTLSPPDATHLSPRQQLFFLPLETEKKKKKSYHKQPVRQEGAGFVL